MVIEIRQDIINLFLVDTENTITPQNSYALKFQWHTELERPYFRRAVLPIFIGVNRIFPVLPYFAQK